MKQVASWTLASPWDDESAGIPCDQTGGKQRVGNGLIRNSWSVQRAVRSLAAVPGQFSTVPVATATAVPVTAVATVSAAVAAVASARALPDQRAELDPSVVLADAARAYLVGGVIDVVVRHEVRVRVLRRQQVALVLGRGVVEVTDGVVDTVPLAEDSGPDRRSRPVSPPRDRA